MSVSNLLFLSFTNIFLYIIIYDGVSKIGNSKRKETLLPSNEILNAIQNAFTSANIALSRAISAFYRYIKKVAFTFSIELLKNIFTLHHNRNNDTQTG